MKKGAKIISKGMQLIVKNGPVTLTFQQCLETTSSFVLGLEIKPKVSEFAGYTGKNRKLNAAEWHGNNLDMFLRTLCIVRQITTEKQFTKNLKIVKTA